MKPLRLIPFAVFMATLIGGLGLMPTFTPSASIALAQEQEEEEVMMKQRGKKRNLGQISKPGSEKMGKEHQGADITDKQQKKKKNTKKRKSEKKTKR